MTGGTASCPPCTAMTDAHAHGTATCASGGIPRLWNIGNPSLPVPENIDFSAGIHPQDAGKWNLSAFEPFFASPHCLAVGECGMDRTISVPLTRQTDLFLSHVSRANQLGKPLVIHCVRCAQELLHLKSRLEQDRVPWVIHGFRGAKRKAFELLDAGCVLSFGGGLLRDAGNMAYFQEIPLDRILMETDESPDLLGQIYAEAAALHLVSLPEFMDAVNANFNRIFHHAGL